MKESEAVQLVILALRRRSVVQGTPVFDIEANAEPLARTILGMAVRQVGRTQAVAFNRANVTFTLTAGQSKYTIGNDIIENYPAVWNMQHLWLTDVPDYHVRVVGLDEFNSYARGSSRTGRPILATIHSKDVVIEFWPTPDSAYTLVGYAKQNLSAFEDIPDAYRDVVLTKAFEIVHAAVDPNMAVRLAELGQYDMQSDAQTGWAGSVMKSAQTLGTRSRTKPDSFDVTGE